MSPEEVVEALVQAHAIRPERYTILGDNGLSREAAERLAAVTGVIGWIMADITLLSQAQAKVGFEFVYQGAAPVCRTCPYRHACLTLDAGRRYPVTHVRPVTHPCALQETSALPSWRSKR